ncbi:MAG: ribose 5-phosphate isomerase B [Bdellovibrionia bacterium]
MSDVVKPSLKILIASDHAGFELKKRLIQDLPQWSWEDLGPQSTEKLDYPDAAAQVARRISSGQAQQGILICGTGIGMSIAANKFPHIRAALAHDLNSARLSREHNDANILCLGARLLSAQDGVEIVRVWLTTAFSGESRHADRIKKIEALEEKWTTAKDSSGDQTSPVPSDKNSNPNPTRRARS